MIGAFAEGKMISSSTLLADIYEIFKLAGNFLLGFLF
jgi:hypothetical protein